MEASLYTVALDNKIENLQKNSGVFKLLDHC